MMGGCRHVGIYADVDGVIEGITGQVSIGLHACGI